MTGLPTDIVSLAELEADSVPLAGEWPVQDEDFLRFSRGAYRVFAEAVAMLDGPARDVFLADLRMTEVLVQAFHAAAVERACIAQQTELRIGPLASAFYRPDWTQIAEQHDRALAAGANTRFARLRQLRRYLTVNRHRRVPARVADLLGGRAIWALGTPGPLLSEWARRSGASFVTPILSRMRGRPDPAWASELGAAVEHSVAGVRRLASRFTDAQIDHGAAAQSWRHRLTTLAILYAGAREMRAPRTVLVSGAGNPFHRAAALAARRGGARVVSAQHGHNAGHVDADIICYNDYAICDVFVCETAGAAEVAQRRSEIIVVPAGRKIEFQSLPSSVVTRRWQARGGRNAAATKTVMVMGFAHSGRRTHTDVAYLSYPRAVLERRLGKLLRGDGYRVLYKAHPEFASVTRGPIGSHFHEFLPEPFGKIGHRADVLVFTYPLTTAFAEALLTDAGIVMLDFAGQEWSPHERESLERRVAMVPATVERGVRLTFRPEDLRAAIARAPTLQDPDYVRRFMLPEGA